jgi:hypothetical protein
MESNFVVVSVSGERKVVVTSTPCNGDASFISYRIVVDGQSVQGGVCKPADVAKIVRKWANRMLIGVSSVKKA